MSRALVDAPYSLGNVMNKLRILEEIRRTAATNEGVPLGAQLFARETGITKTDWLGKFWARWGDAVREAGFTANTLNHAIPESELIERLIPLIRELGHFPVHSELRLHAHREPGFPSTSTLARLGPKLECAAKVIAYCESREGDDDVISMCRPTPISAEPSSENASAAEEVIGFVYLLKSGRKRLGRPARLAVESENSISSFPRKPEPST